MTREHPQFQLRLPQELLAKIRKLAERENRSVTAQIVWLLRKALGDEK